MHGQGRTAARGRSKGRTSRTVFLGRDARHALSGVRLDDLIVAVNEAAANVLEHGGGAGSVLGHRDTDGVWLQVLDTAGTLTAEHLRGRPGPHSRRGYGLRLAHRLCDPVLLDHPDGRSRLRLYVRYQAAPGRAEDPAGPADTATVTHG